MIKRMKKVLILSAGYGEGHNTAARNLRAALDEMGVAAEVVDLFEVCYGRFNEVVKSAYLGTINHAPWVWQKIYGVLDSTTLFESSLPTLSKLRHRLAELLLNERPDAVVSTYPVYNYLLNQIFPDRSKRTFTQLTVVTDSITINSIWHRCPCDYFLVPNEQTAAVMRAARVPPEQIHVLGFPVSMKFADARTNREIPGAATPPRVLYMINFGRKNAPDLLRHLLQIPMIEISVTVGRDPGLQSELEKICLESGRKADVYGWTDQLPNLLMSHHVLISKAGGATVQEAIAAKTPMIISQVVPGQEEGNARLIFENDCGALAESHEAIAATVRRAFENDAAVWKNWETHIAQLSKPDAARATARFVTEHLPADAAQ
jgi:processive 1,2-diacylglycerol beta-glucosyltransferase